MSVNVTFAKLFDRASEQGFADKETGVGAFEVKELKADSSPVPMKLLRVEQKDIAACQCFEDDNQYDHRRTHTKSD